MERRQNMLRPTSVMVLELIAEGRTYEQILALHPQLTYLDIFQAAGEALALTVNRTANAAGRLSRTREKHRRACEKWSPEEEIKLVQLTKSGANESDIASQLERQPSAVRSRMIRLGLIQPPQ